jgi:hypothetical protein
MNEPWTALEQRANEALRIHDRLLLLNVLNLLHNCTTLNEAIEKIAGYLDNTR